MTARFTDRIKAGRELGELLAGRSLGAAPIALGLPRGGVPVAAEVAKLLGAPLDMFSVRKLGVPGYPELALGAVATGGVRVLNQDVLAGMPEVGAAQIDEITERELDELRRRELAYRGDRKPLDLTGRTAILIDDGIATGATMRAAMLGAQARAAGVIVAAPVASWQAVAQLEEEVEVAVVYVPSRFGSVGAHFGDFNQVTDDEVRELLA